MATGPLDTDSTSSLDAGREALERRCAAAEAEVVRLTAEVSRLRIEAAAGESVSAETLSLFDDGSESPRLTGDGSDPRVLSLVLGATAVVAGMVTVLALLNGKLTSVFGIAILALTIGLAWGAARTRVIPTEVEVARGVVYVKQGETSYRFDLKKADTQVEMHGRPGDAGWAVHFPRRHLDDFVIDGSMVDASEFLRQVREFRPEL